METYIFISVIVGILAIAFYICWRFFKKRYGKYVFRTFIIPLLIMSALIIGGSAIYNLTSVGEVGRFDYQLSLIVSVIYILPLYILNTIYYFIIKWIKRNEQDEDEIRSWQQKQMAERKRTEAIERQRAEQNRKQAEQERKRQEQEVLALENDDMRDIKKILASIPERIKALNLFSNELTEKCRKLESIAEYAIANAYGDYTCGNNSILRYKELQNNYSSKIDPILVLQCDKMINKVTSAITQKQTAIVKNNNDIQQYHQLESQLIQQYNRELKIQKMKKISSQLSMEISESEDDLTTSIHNGYSIEKALDEFEQLNRAMQERRDYEIKFGQIDI